MATPTQNSLHGAAITPASSNSLMPQQTYTPLGKLNLQATQALLCPGHIFLSVLYECFGVTGHLCSVKE